MKINTDSKFKNPKTDPTIYRNIFSFKCGMFHLFTSYNFGYFFRRIPPVIGICYKIVVLTETEGPAF